MTKQEAADYLRVSVRTLENYVAKNRLAVTYLQGKTRSVADFKKLDLDRLKAELALVEHRPVVEAPARQALQRQARPSAEAQAIGRFEDLVSIAEAVKGAQAGLPLDRKLALTVREASEYSGFSLGAIKAAIEGGKLKASKLGPRGAWVVKRADLERWVKGL
jgi:excisionase family DNA binding protein